MEDENFDITNHNSQGIKKAVVRIIDCILFSLVLWATDVVKVNIWHMCAAWCAGCVFTYFVFDRRNN